MFKKKGAREVVKLVKTSADVKRSSERRKRREKIRKK